MTSKSYKHKKNNKNAVSKKLFIAILCFLSTTLFAQEKASIAPKNYTVAMDSLLRFVNKKDLKTGLLYDRVVANANLLEFNNKDNKKSSSYWHYIQALSEIHRSSLDPKNKMQDEVVDDLKRKNDNVLNIAYINTSVDYIDQGTEQEPKLLFNEGFFRNIEGKNPFKQKQITVVAALVETIVYKDIKIRLNPDMIYQDDSNQIKNLSALINGTEIKLVANFENLKEATDYQLKGDEKEIVFNIEFKDTTKIQTRAAISVSLQQTTNLDPCFTEDFLGASGIDRNSPENTIPFQSYDSTDSIKGVLEYRTYYNQVTNTCQSKKINKPVIILDGFDPGDTRKLNQLYNIMFYPDAAGVSTNFVDKLTSTDTGCGFDVTLVNFTENKIVDPDRPTREVWVQTGTIVFGSWTVPIGNWTTVTNYKVLADGGADYIERNAMAVVALLKRENEKLSRNGSTEKITLIGPSMGGLISRYALAYMEKNNIPHNVNLWVSFDSPHLGANIPISTQSELLFLGTIAESAEAAAKYRENLLSPAERQMLIEQVNSSAKNNSHPFRQQFLQNQISNSLPNTNGFPTGMRKVALINGTTSGVKTNFESQVTYDVAVFGLFNLKAFYLVTRNLATPNNWVTSFEGRFTKKILCGIPFTNMTYFCGLEITTQERNDLNINPRGSMDVVQGGTYNTFEIVKKSIDENPAIQEQRVENRAFVANHAFIPTVSSLAFKNPNFDWTAPINRNLLCDPANKEIVFDSYFSPSKNEKHVALTNDSVNWLLKEIQGNPQVPSFYIPENNFVGPNLVCLNSNSTFSLGADICKLPSAVASWSVTPAQNAQIISSTSLSVILKGLVNGSCTITATFQNGQTVTKTIWVGKPIVDATLTLYPGDRIKNKFCFISDIPGVSLAQQGIIISLTPGLESTYCYRRFLEDPELSFTIANICGSITYTPLANRPANTNTNLYKIYPNPSNSIVSIDLRDQELQPELSTPISGELFDMFGFSRANVEIIDNKANFSVVGLPKGIYILKINVDGKVESHQIAVE